MTRPQRTTTPRSSTRMHIGTLPHHPRRHFVRLPQKTLYVIDEPERHLHPTAQADVAEWVAQLGAQQGADVIVASHASSFLNLPSALVEYILVYRDEERITRATTVTGDVIGLLDSIAEDADPAVQISFC